MHKKRGESAGGAAALVAVIGLIITLYIVFLPPDDRVDLLDASRIDDNNDGSKHIDGNRTLLLEFPGRLDKRVKDDFEHNIPPVYLFRTTEASELKAVSSLTVSSGSFDKQFPSFEFTVDDLTKTDNLLFTFAAPTRSGELTINLNGRTIFQQEVSTQNPSPITLSKDYLSARNTLEFFVDDVGWQFWKTNKYVLENMRIIGQITDDSRQESRNVFIMTDEEFFNVEEAQIIYNPECIPFDTGVLNVWLNNNVLFSGVPDCGSFNKRDIPLNMFERGENTLVFKTERGSYLIDNIEIRTETEEEEFPVYFFFINDTLFEEVENNTLHAKVTFDFFDDRRLKQGRLLVNQRLKSFSTRDKNVTIRINALILRGNNGIRIEPESDELDILRMEVFLEDPEDLD